MGKKRPKAPDSEGKGTEKTRTKQGEVLPKDKRALEATSSDYSTESDEGGEVLASSSTTPWQRRVRLRTALAAKDKTQDPSPVECAGEEGMAEASKYPTTRRVEAHQRYMVGSSIPVFPGPCCRLCRRHSDSTGVPGSLCNFASMASQRPGQSSLHLPRHGVQAL